MMRKPSNLSHPVAHTQVEGPLTPLDLGPANPSLGTQLEAAYQYARNALRSNNGIRVLMHLLQPLPTVRAGSLQPGALDKIRTLACRTLIGLARDNSIKHILARLQLGRQLSELVREPGQTATAPRRSMAGGAGPGAEAAPITSRTDWHAAFGRAAMELIALTAGPAAGQLGMGRHDKVTAAAATDATAPALHKIERAAIAAATPLTYNPQEVS